MSNPNKQHLPIARGFQAFAQSSNRVSIASAKAARETAWRLLVELYSWPEDQLSPSIEDIARAIDVPLTLSLRLVVALRDADLIMIEGNADAAKLRVSLSGLGLEQVGTLLASAAAKFNEEMTFFAG